LLPDGASGDWKALSVFMMMDDLKGHEEVGYEDGVYGGHTLGWEDVNRERREKVESNPHVIVGSFERTTQINKVVFTYFV
jgi:hypothetical protein